jgi:glucose-6-phosphate 1-dehydrogenase
VSCGNGSGGRSACDTPPQRLFDYSAPASGPANYLRFRISPYSAIALAARVKRAGKDFVGDHQGLYPVEAQRGED